MPQPIVSEIASYCEQSCMSISTLYSFWVYLLIRYIGCKHLTRHPEVLKLIQSIQGNEWEDAFDVATSRQGKN